MSDVFDEPNLEMQLGVEGPWHACLDYTKTPTVDVDGEVHAYYYFQPDPATDELAPMHHDYVTQTRSHGETHVGKAIIKATGEYVHIFEIQTTDDISECRIVDTGYPFFKWVTLDFMQWIQMYDPNPDFSDFDDSSDAGDAEDE